MAVKTPLNYLPFLLFSAQCAVYHPKEIKQQETVAFAGIGEDFLFTPELKLTAKPFGPARGSREDRTIEKLLELRDDEDGCVFCTEEEIQAYVEEKGTLEDARRYMKLTTVNKNSLKRSKNGGLALFVSEGGTVELAEKLLDIVYKKGETSDSVFQAWEEMALFLHVSGTVDFASDLQQFKSPTRENTFTTAEEYAYAAYVSPNIQTVRALNALEYNGQRILSAMEIIILSSHKLQLGKLWISSLSPAKIDELRKITSPDGTSLFRTFDDFYAVATGDVDLDKVRNLTIVPVDTGAPLFQQGADAVYYVKSGKDDTYLHDMLKIHNAKEEQIITGGGVLASLAAMNISPAQVAERAGYESSSGIPLLAPYEATYYAGLGLTKEEILVPEKTKKLDALIFFADPRSDYNQALLNSVVAGHIENIGETFDKTIDYGNRDDLVSYTSLHNYHFLMLAGHGNGEEGSITVGLKDQSGTYLSQKDQELCALLGTLPPNADVLLFSCYGGRGRAQGENFANFVAACAPGRRVTSSTTLMNAGDLKIASFSPLTATITSTKKHPFNTNLWDRSSVTESTTYVAFVEPKISRNP